MNWRKHQARQNARYFQSYGVIFCSNLKTLGLILYFMNALTLALKHVLLFILVIVIKKSLCLLMLSQYYSRSGGCMFGKDCKFDHTKGKYSAVQVLEFNFLGLPIRLV